MESLNFPANIHKCLLALGPESDGNFSAFHKGILYRSDSFGDLLNEESFQKFTQAVAKFLKNNRINPDVILTDLHPFYRTTALGESLSKKYKARHIKIQHHVAHVFSTIGDRLTGSEGYKLKTISYGLACDGTGYGLDEKIWGGEVFRIKTRSDKVKSVERIGHLENQFMIGGDLAVKEPARMLIGILSKFLPEDETYGFVKKYYSKKKFGVLSSQMKQNFNCQDTSSAGRVLDAVSVLLGFSGNVRKYKHSPAIALENNSTIPYADLKSVVKKYETQNAKYKAAYKFVLKTTPLFEYLVKNINKDKHRLASTAQLYLARGLHDILKLEGGKSRRKSSFFAGGIANNKMIYSHLKSKGVYASKKIPRGDAGVSFGQIIYYLLADPRD